MPYTITLDPARQDLDAIHKVLAGTYWSSDIRREVVAFVRRTGRDPKVILLQNHGIIAVGASPKAVLGSLLMAEKAAEIFVGAAALGGPVFLTAAQCERIAGRPDEHYRQKVLGL